MNLTGNKTLTTLLLTGSVLSAAVQAESPVDNSEAIELTTFSANTPAKAADVNGNFEAMKTYIEKLEAKIEVLERGSYTIPVYGDGELIGYSKPTAGLIGDRVQIKTQYGLATLWAKNGKFVLAQADTGGSYHRVLFSDNTCTQPVVRIPTNMIFKTTKDKKSFESSLAGYGDKEYEHLVLIPQDQALMENNPPFYDWKLSFEQGALTSAACELVESFSNDYKFHLEAEVIKEEEHNLKESYLEIEIGNGLVF